jgi:predicted PurR-regulated permease PerM
LLAGGGQTALYLAVKNRSPQLVEMLVEQGASLDTTCFSKTIAAHIREKMPDLNLATLSQSRRMRAPLVKQASTSVLERLAQVVDHAALGKVICYFFIAFYMEFFALGKINHLPRTSIKLFGIHYL